jgi:hypothetical protein
MFPKAVAPIDDWDPCALLSTPHQWQLCRSLVDTNIGQMKIDYILKRRLIVSDAIPKYPAQLYLLLADMKEMDGHVCGWEQSSGNIEGNATSLWYWNPIAEVQYILGHAPFKDHLSYAPGKQLDFSREHIYAEIWTADWWRKTQAIVLVLSERLFLLRFSLCLGELECQREHIRKIMSERSC